MAQVVGAVGQLENPCLQWKWNHTAKQWDVSPRALLPILLAEVVWEGCGWDKGSGVIVVKGQ